MRRSISDSLTHKFWQTPVATMASSDVLTVTRSGRLAILELKATEFLICRCRLRT